MWQGHSVGFTGGFTIRLRIILGLLGLFGSTLAMGLAMGLAPESSWAQNGSSTMGGTYRRSGGSRGCALAAPGGDTLLAAKPALVLLGAEGVMQTSAQAPLFAWYVRDRGSWPLEFRIYRQRLDAPDEAELVVELANAAVVSQAGIMTLPLPEQVTTLEPGRRYWWQVELRCDPHDASANIFAEAELEVSNSGRLVSHPLNQGRGEILGEAHGETHGETPEQTLSSWLRAKAKGEALPRVRPDWTNWGLSVAEAEAIELGQVSWVVLPSSQSPKVQKP